MDDTTEFEASSQGWIDAAVEQQVRRKRAEARLLEVEAERDKFHQLWKDACVRSGKNSLRAEAAEAALVAAYRLAMGDAARRVEALAAGNPFSAGQYANSAFVIRRLPTPTAAELMARINEGEKE